MKIDTAVKQKNNLMFLSHDEEVYYNPDAHVFSVNIQESNNMLKTLQDLVDIEKKALENSKPYERGNRNNTIHRIASFMNYYGIEQTLCYEYLQNKYNLNPREIKKAVKSAYKRKAQFGQANRHSDKTDIPTLGGTPFLPDSVIKCMPKELREVIALYKGHQRDVFVLSLFGMLSGCLGYTHFLYGTKKYKANTFTLMVAPPASGKGAIDDVKKLGLAINKELHQEWLAEKERVQEDMPEPVLKSLIIAGNGSAAGRIEDLKKNDGCGVIMESEADTISASSKQDWGDTSYMERQAFEHESISTSRKGEKISIENPRLSVVVAGTPNQVKPYLESAENGLFSRYLFYLFETEVEWIDQFAVADTGINEKLEKTSEYVKQLFFLYREYSFELTISELGRKKLNELCADTITSLSKYDPEVASVKRLAVITIRIALILTSLREFDQKTGQIKIECDDDIWEASLEMNKILYEHMIRAVRLLSTKKSSKDKFYMSLPFEFKTSDAQKIGEQYGLQKRNVERKLKALVEGRKLIKTSHGNYSKPNG